MVMAYGYGGASKDHFGSESMSVVPQSVGFGRRRRGGGGLSWLGLVLAAGSVILAIYIWNIVTVGFRTVYQQGSTPQIACDLCGKAVTEYYSLSFNPVSSKGPLDGVTEAVGTFIMGAPTPGGDSVEGAEGRHYDFCPTCYQELISWYHWQRSQK